VRSRRTGVVQSRESETRRMDRRRQQARHFRFVAHPAMNGRLPLRWLEGSKQKAAPAPVHAGQRPRRSWTQECAGLGRVPAWSCSRGRSVAEAAGTRSTQLSRSGADRCRVVG
jgi:hypothetical protein